MNTTIVRANEFNSFFICGGSFVHKSVEFGFILCENVYEQTFFFEKFKKIWGKEKEGKRKKKARSPSVRPKPIVDLWNLVLFHLEIYLTIFFSVTVIINQTFFLNAAIVRANEFAFCWNIDLIIFFPKISGYSVFFANLWNLVYFGLKMYVSKHFFLEAICIYWIQFRSKP